MALSDPEPHLRYLRSVGVPDPSDEDRKRSERVAQQILTGAMLTRASDVTPKRTQWFWEGRIPMSKITALDGHPGQGKSTLTMALAAAATTATRLPQQPVPQHPMGVVILSAEDEAEDTIVPRLQAHGADLSKVYILDAVAPTGGTPKRLWSLPGDIDVLEATVKDVDAGLVIVDPLMSYLHSAHDSYRDQDVRSALHPLADMAKRTGAAVILVRHLTKSGTGPAMMRGSGSVGIVGAARAGLVVAQDPEDDSGQTRILAVSKLNLGRKGDSLEFTLEYDEDHHCARVKWMRISGHTAESALAYREDR